MGCKTQLTTQLLFSFDLCVSLCSGVASYGALGHVLPRLLTILFLFPFGVNLTANYPTIV